MTGVASLQVSVPVCVVVPVLYQPPEKGLGVDSGGCLTVPVKDSVDLRVLRAV